MKWFRDRRVRVAASAAGTVLAVAVSLGAVQPLANLHPLLFAPGRAFSDWVSNVRAGSAVESAIYRLMDLPGGPILFRRAPRETIPALTQLEQSQKGAALYPLRAMEEEQALDFPAAERDWKTWAETAEDRAAAHEDLAAFNERRLRPQQELAALETTGNSPSDPRERWTAVESQRSWQAFERALHVVDEYALPRSESARIYAEWLRRYPSEPPLYQRQFAFLLEGRDFAAAEAALAKYRAAFPGDEVFPVKAEADLAVRRGGSKDGLAIYDGRFEPLWPAELIKSYIGLVLGSHNEHAFSDELRARIAADPDDLKDAARLFYLYQQQGRMDSAKAVLTAFRESKEARGAKWSSTELDTLERLFEAIQGFPEAARYAYALASDRSTPTSDRDGLIALTRILLTAPEQPLRVGAGNLALYRNIATMDRGPGYLNGILSLFLNTQNPDSEYSSEDQLAVPYFHRARAAELLAEIDRRFPDDPARAQLHASLMEAYGVYGENAAVIREGTYILAQFPKYPGRVHVALLLADAYERTQQAEKEFALYRDLLKELAAQADGIPLGGPGTAYKPVQSTATAPAYTVAPPAASAAPSGDSDEAAAPASAAALPRSPEYAKVLDRYLARLVSLQRLPDALVVLRGELDRNPRDPGLYERLADFLQQNALNSHEEEVFQRAIQQFQDTTWNAKLARFYLRQRRNADYSALMHKVAEIFSGTELENFLEQAPAPNASLAMQVDLYAHQRFPHDLRFVEDLIPYYVRDHNDAALVELLWQHWFESPNLRDRLFEILSGTGRLDSTLATLRQQTPEIEKADWTGLADRNAAAERFWLEACIWQSHFEQGVGAADALASAYPADAALGDQASSLYRSLAHFHPEDTDKAVAIERHLLEADPGNLDRLARIGDIYADRGRFKDAAPYWVRMGEVRPGQSEGYLGSATVFWDYFDFASAQAQLDKARAKLNEPTLFAYQEGALAESRGDSPAAVRAYVAGATADNASAESRDRLLALARRPALREQIESGTAGLLQQRAPSAAAIQLRASILEAEHRKDELWRELEDLITRTSSFDVLDAISSAAQGQNLDEVEQSARRREIALTADPVRNLQLRYQLVDLLQRHDAAAGAQEVDAIYRDHGKILGVVRSTVDYDWDHDRKQQAVAVLLGSAQLAYPDLKSRFQLEAARKLTDLGDYPHSRAILAALLKEKPLDAEYEAAMADNLARSNDQAGLESFYAAQLELVRYAQLNGDERQQRIGQLRRGIIAASTQLGNYNDAVDQYVELINAFPDDAGLAQEAALYAVAHNNSKRLIAFYEKTIGESPRDPRWSIVLARIAMAAEQYPLAVDSYSKALRLRPERQDLYVAQAALDERLYKFDDAVALYRKLYTLSYRDPQWMVRVAELCARESRNADAVQALETAWIENRPVKASNYFAVAERLEKWNLLDEAQHFAEQGVQTAGADLLITEQAGAATYARILTRNRQAGAAFARLAAARADAPSTGIAVVAQQVMQQGPEAITNEEWRKQRQEQRRMQATSGFSTALQAMSAAAGEFYTPEEKLQFAGLLRQHAGDADHDELLAVYLPAARAAKLADLTADLQWQAIVQDRGGVNLEDWLQFERQRVQLDFAAALLEKAAPSRAYVQGDQMYREAAGAYRASGDTVSELRVTEHIYRDHLVQGDALTRFYRLLLAQRPDELNRIAASEDSAAAYLIRSGTPAQALAAVTARAAGREPVWGDAFTALAGLYVHANQPEIASAFASALDTGATIGERVAHPLDRSQHLAGDVWFYYGSRYAEYLDGAGNPQAEDYLPSELEHTPGNANAYLRLADYAADSGRTDAALSDYQHSLDLKPDQPAVLDKIAVLQWGAGRHSAALALWKLAVERLAAEIDERPVPESFWPDFDTVLASIAAHKQFDSVRDAVDAMLRVYIRRNGNYRVEPLLKAGYGANGGSVDWLLNITTAATDQAAVLNAIMPNSWSDEGNWIAADQLDRVDRRILELDLENAGRNPTDTSGFADSARRNLVAALVREKKFQEAERYMADVAEAQRNSVEWLPLQLQVAQADGSLKARIASWTTQPAGAPGDDALRASAIVLEPSAHRAVLRFEYQRALDRRELSAPNFLGLASIDLDENDTAGAVGLLKRLTIVGSDMYSDTDAAAHLLESHHLAAESIPFLRLLAQAIPWDASYKVRLAKALLAANTDQGEALSILATVVSDPKAAYAIRRAAAQALRGQTLPTGVGGELQLVAQTACPPPESASRPYFVAARVRAAECSATPKAKESLLREALAAAPEDACVRVRYIFAAFAAKFDSRALIAAEPYLQQYPSYGAGASYSPAEEDAASAEPADAPATLAALPRDQALELLELASAAYERRRDYADAGELLRRALPLCRTDAERTTIAEGKTKVDREAARLAENDARAPAIHAPLEQPNTVRPKLRSESMRSSALKPNLGEGRL